MAPTCPVDAAARCASNAASEQRRLVASLCASPTARRRPLACLRSRSPARRRSVLRFCEGAARGESTKQHGQRARLPQSKALSSNRRSCAFKRGMYLQLLAMKSLQPWPPLWPDARSKSLQPSAPRRSLQASSRAASRLRAKTPCEAKHRDRSSAAKLWAQAGAAATFINVSATQLDPRPAQRKSLQPLPELSPAAASGEIAAASVNPRRPAQASSSCVTSARVLGNGANNVANARNSLRRRIKMRISSVCAAGLWSSRDQALPLSLALPGSKFKP